MLRLLIIAAALAGCATVECSVGENLIIDKDGRKHCVMPPVEPKKGAPDVPPKP